MKNDNCDDAKIGAINYLKDTLRAEKIKEIPLSLDDLIELLDADDLRNIVGMMRPKGQPGADI